MADELHAMRRCRRLTPATNRTHAHCKDDTLTSAALQVCSCAVLPAATASSDPLLHAVHDSLLFCAVVWLTACSCLAAAGWHRESSCADICDSTEAQQPSSSTVRTKYYCIRFLVCGLSVAATSNTWTGCAQVQATSGSCRPGRVAKAARADKLRSWYRDG